MTASKIHSNIIFSQQIETELAKIIGSYPAGKVFLLTEEIPAKLCLPLIQSLIDQYNIRSVTIQGGENNKSIRSVEKVWEMLSKHGADRKSLLINIGGGMLTDLGGFAASTFKRGMAFVNIPTTLLSQVDASIGGKTGINFNGLKNEIGVFNEPDAVIINTNFLKTIDGDNFLSGYAEMLKHGLIKSPEHWDELMQYDLNNINYESLQEIIAHSVAVKEWHVLNDLTEKNIRKALNFGHTVGHAFESYALHEGRPILHGHAVVYGMIAELYLSAKKCGFSEQLLQSISVWMLQKYGKFEISKADYEALYELMTHDKKNEGNRINFTLIPTIGQVEINQDCPKELIFEALDLYRQLSI
ncbi:3-dehydroquinate synthase [Mangrovibacterium marinum]|uniref:3-dehydroquinate synthase n=1 Tax=Mangrovibacterium marinum TaxID=1639118 RepID=A0A2T5C050_9BACT|nr:3-dehydroquinate synthase [Mangrovibacterium marinum]PTN07941.1 3-dehydroquinate synthase [Mangrovibacterium marinum]